MTKFTLFYYQKVLKEIPDDPVDSILRIEMMIIIVGLLMLGVSHFFLTLPHTLRYIITEPSTLSLMTNLGSLGALISSVIIFLGFIARTQQKEQEN